MNFFNENTSNYIQFFSMFMEIIGITLAYIEIRYKPLANRIETRILTEESRIRDFAFKLLENKLFSALIVVFVITVFFIGIPYMAGFFDRILPPDMKDIQTTILWLTMPIVVLFVVGMCTVLLGDFVSWLNRFSEGHAIGSLGVVVTFLGLLGECYQVLTIAYGT